MFAHYSAPLAIIALALTTRSALASDAPAADVAVKSGFLEAQKPRVFAVNTAAGSALTGMPADSFGGAGQPADVAPTATPKAVSDGSSEAYGMPLSQQAGAIAGPGAMPAAPSEGGSGSASTVMTAVGVTILLMALCFCCIGYCCCKEVCGCLWDGVGEAGGDYDLANLGEAAAAGAAVDHVMG